MIEEVISKFVTTWRIGTSSDLMGDGEFNVTDLAKEIVRELDER